MSVLLCNLTRFNRQVTCLSSKDDDVRVVTYTSSTDTVLLWPTWVESLFTTHTIKYLSVSSHLRSKSPPVPYFP